MLRPIPYALLVSALIFASGCGQSDDPVDDDPGGIGGNAHFQVRQSVEQLHITHAEPDTELLVVDDQGNELARGVADYQGSLVFRKLPPGEGYEVRTADEAEHAGPLVVMSEENSLPDQDFYSSQVLQPGFNYITTRDGTELAVYVTLPGPIEEGPYPTVVNYSGYNPAKPGEPLGDFDFLCDSIPAICDAPSDPSGMIAALMGYATVGVNMRGTGCSGGAYDFFEPLQLLDGYDVIETVAAQSWVKHNRVGMTGLSYPGISQMYVAKTQPPSLAAITPLSVLGSTGDTLVPGGILNDGFALSWVTNVLDKADPFGQGWEQDRVDGGDDTCAENQLLHSQKVNVIEIAQNTPFYDERAEAVDATRFVDQVTVPVFLASSWQDEQTGPYFFTLLDRFTQSPNARFTVYNGVHVDGFAPQVLVEWKAFLDLYVAEEVPSMDPELVGLAPLLFQQMFGASIEMPPMRHTEHASHAEALAAYEAEQPLRVIFENGGTSDVGVPVGAFEQSFDQWPPTATTEMRWYLQPGGGLDVNPPNQPSSASQFDLDPAAGQRGILAGGGNVWDALPDYDWRPLDPGMAVVFETAPLAEDLVMLGTGSVDLFIQSNVADADLEVNLSEVRPDGQEMYVQSGWLRASHRTLSDEATGLWPAHTHLEADAADLPAGQWTPVRVGITGFGHVFRAGSRIRLIIDTPGDSRAEWRFDLLEFPGGATHQVAHSATYPSSVALPLLQGVSAPTSLPPCPSLRGQQCRAYTAFSNVRP